MHATPLFVPDAATLATSPDFSGMFLAVVGLLVLCLVGFVGVLFVRRYMQKPDEQVGFSLSELRRLRDTGQMSGEEYDRIRANVVEAHLRRQREEEEEAAKLGEKRLPTEDLKVQQNKNLDLMQR